MSMNPKLIEAFKSAGVDVNSAVQDRYKTLHEKEGIGFPKGQNKASFVSYWFIRDDGSYYKDTIPMAINGLQSDSIAFSYSHVILAMFEINYDTKYKIYGRADEALYKQ